MCFAPAPDGSLRHVVAGCDDGSLRCWDLTTGALLRSYRKKAPEVTALAALARWVNHELLLPSLAC